MKLILCYDNAKLFGVFTEEKKELALKSGMQCELIEAHDTTIHYYDPDPLYFQLFKVIFENEKAVWIRARNFGQAITDAVLLMKEKEECIDVREVEEFSIEEDEYDQIREISSERYVAYPPAKRLLPEINDKNKDFCALMLKELEDVKSEDELKKRCSVQAIKGKSLEEMSANEIREAFLFWNDYAFFEGLDLSFKSWFFVEKIKRTDDAPRMLFWSYVLSFWGGGECSLQYELYRWLTENLLEQYLDEYAKLLES